jgi:hypothetical protein
MGWSLRALRMAAILVGAAVGASLAGCHPIVWRPDLGGAMRLAARENRIVIVAYWSDLNRDCERMENDVFRSPAVVELMGGTVPVRLSAMWNRDWAREAGVSTVPSFVAYDPSGKILRRHEGPLDEPGFRAFLVAANLSR